MPLSVAPPEPSEVGHFERGGRHFDGTPAERALELSMLSVVVLAVELGGDETFLRLRAEVADDPSRADPLAVRYARSGAGRQAVSAMLLKASHTPPELVTTRLMNMSNMRAGYIHAPLEDGDPRNALQERYLETLWRGARVVARRGARRCLECGAYRVRGYCDSHRLEHGQEARDADAARVILRAVAEEFGIPADGPKSRRARRRTIG